MQKDDILIFKTPGRNLEKSWYFVKRRDSNDLYRQRNFKKIWNKI